MENPPVRVVMGAEHEAIGYLSHSKLYIFRHIIRSDKE